MEENRHGYLIEILRLGDYIKVSALDPVTLTEVSLMGPLHANQEQLTKLAVRKLERKLTGQNPVD